MTIHTSLEVPAPEAEGWRASDVPDPDHDDLAHWAAGLGDLGADDTEVEATLDLLRDPTGSGPQPIRQTLLKLGGSTQDADQAIDELEAIQPGPAVPRGVNLDWGPEPDVTYAKLQLEAHEVWKRRRRDRLKDAFLKVLGFDTPVGQPHFEEVLVPILVLAAPAIEGAKVVWKGTEAGEASGGFELTLLGSGLGANRTISIESSRTEICENGEARQVRLSAPVLAQPFGRHRDGRVEVVRYKRELAKAGPGVPLRRFLIDNLHESQLAGLAGPAANEEDRSNDGKPVELADAVAVSGERTLSVGVNYKGVEAKLSGTLVGKQSYDVTSVLPGGRRYRRYYPKDAFGVMWQVLTS
jgi:hypothetical protein